MTESVYNPKEWDNIRPHVSSLDEYKTIYQRSIENPKEYWGEVATGTLEWFRPFRTVQNGSFKDGNIRWFEGGKINACYNCLDRHLAKRADQPAIIWEADQPGKHRIFTYAQVLDEVCRLANLLLSLGVKVGDRVAIYMPMVPEAAFAMLACTRIGAVHSVIFAGFSSESLRSRVEDANCEVIITANVGLRGGKIIPLKPTVDKAIDHTRSPVKHVLVYQHVDVDSSTSSSSDDASGSKTHKYPPVSMTPGRDLWLHEEIGKHRPYCPPVEMDSEDPLFMLYTSGSTGKPKGIIHTTGGYLTYVAHTSKNVWDLHEGDRFACVADVGWITGHSYVVYGPLLNGTTTLIFESLPTFPDASRYWKMVEQYRITQLYTAPTVIRTLMGLGDQWLDGHDLSSVRVLGSVGEPINPEAWRWYYNVVGKGKCSVVDSYWQTETGGIVIVPLPGATPTKPGSATFPFFGQLPKLLDAVSGEEIHGEGEGLLVLAQPWPSMARTIYGDHSRFMETYLNPYPGYYFTGDGARRDADGYIWITGRVDDVINKCGHRLGTAEIESALVLHPSCSEAAVVAIPDDVRGQAIVAFACLNYGEEESESLVQQLKLQVRSQIGGIAVPDWLIILPGLPKTRSGKIMRRILRKVAENDAEHIGDISTLADPSVVKELIQRVQQIIYSK